MESGDLTVCWAGLAAHVWLGLLTSTMAITDYYLWGKSFLNLYAFNLLINKNGYQI